MAEADGLVTSVDGDLIHIYLGKELDKNCKAYSHCANITVMHVRTGLKRSRMLPRKYWVALASEEHFSPHQQA